MAFLEPVPQPAEQQAWTMTARGQEEHLLARCAAIAHGAGQPLDPREANVCNVAAMILGRHLDRQARNLARASRRYFEAHPHEKLEPGQVVGKGWISGLPRLRDMLIRKIEGRS